MALIVGGSLMAIGIFGWGNLYEAGDTPVVGSVILAFYTGGMSALNIASGAYTVDAYREVSVELVIIVMVVKNFLFFGLSYFFNNAVAARGPAFMFNIVGGIVLFGVVILGIPVYMFGKRYVLFFVPFFFAPSTYLLYLTLETEFVDGGAELTFSRSCTWSKTLLVGAGVYVLFAVADTSQIFWSYPVYPVQITSSGLSVSIRETIAI